MSHYYEEFQETSHVILHSSKVVRTGVTAKNCEQKHIFVLLTIDFWAGVLITERPTTKSFLHVSLDYFFFPFDVFTIIVYIQRFCFLNDLSISALYKIFRAIILIRSLTYLHLYLLDCYFFLLYITY